MNKLIKQVSFILVVAGALNWGLAALGYNALQMLFGSMPTLLKVLYGAVGVAGLIEIYNKVKK